MRVFIRTDASIQIGAGHVMRCLTLADELKTQGAVIKFITRAHLGNMADAIIERGYELCLLPAHADTYKVRPDDVDHASWLSVSWQQDAEESRLAIGDSVPEWLIVDHYGIDARWHNKLRAKVDRIMVIDDLTDRPHACDLLFDQNLGRVASDYTGLVPEQCVMLIGPEYALLRPEFAALRDYSLQRRKKAEFHQLLLSMGGVDQHNATGKILEALKLCPLPTDCRIIVVMGKNAPWLDEIQRVAKTLPWQTGVLINVNNMAEQMADSDLAIGAGGSSAWERCCLGLPSIVIPVAENQLSNCTALENSGAAMYVKLENVTASGLGKVRSCFLPIISSEWRSAASVNASRTVDGKGTIRTSQTILECI